MSESPLAPPKASTPVLIQFGRYVIHRLIGMGGMAEVYRAAVSGPEGFEKPVVIKRVRSQYAQDETFVHMFADEAKICASLNHANLVSVFDFGSEAGHYYMAMEFIDGLDLRTAHVRYAQRHGRPLPWEVSTLILRDMLRGLDYAHKLADPLGRPMGIVHRDIDLANVMVRRDGAVKVLDFGCAKAASFVRRTETIAGVIKGKLGYMSPEQAEDRTLDARSDVWAAGVVLHELLTGRRLFYGEDAVAVIRSVLGRTIPDPVTLNPAVPAVLSQITLRALTRDRDQRYPAAGAMADALEGVILEHRIPVSRITDELGALMDDPAAVGTEITADQRRLTLAAWAESTADAEPMEIVSGVLVDDGQTEIQSAPFIDATILTTSPRWHFPGESSASSAPPEMIHERRTEILQAQAPPVGLHAEETTLLGAPSQEETVLLTEADRKAPAPAPRPPEEPVPLTHVKIEAPRARPPWPLIAVVVVGAAVVALLLSPRWCG